MNRLLFSLAPPRARFGLALSLCLLACQTPAVHAPVAVPSAPEKPRLVVQITIDQLRFDLIGRMADRLGPGGFKRLLGEGLVYRNAHYTHTITETSVGHATLFTGALPRDHGIVGNEWFDFAHKKPVYAVDDPTTTLVGAQGSGRSPRNLLVPTYGDVLREQTGNRALVVAVSEKDRGAVLPGGHAGRAYWLDEPSGLFVTSSYYPAPPAWISERAARYSVEQLRGKRWELSLPEDQYRATDDAPWERSYKQLGRVFPHPLDAVELKDFVRGIKCTPFADELVLAFVTELLAAEPFGQDDVPDLLAVSFSSTDYVGHAFGPESREAEDNLVRLDRTLANLLTLLEQRVGKAHVLVALSADHGIAESPEWFKQRGENVDRIDPQAVMVALNNGLRERFTVDADLVIDFVNPTFVLDEANIAALGLDLRVVELATVELVLKQPGFEKAYARSNLMAGRFGDDPLAQRVAASMLVGRSGNVYLVPREHWLLAGEPFGLAAMHGTPWPYDSHVPILFWGAGIAPAVVDRAVDPRDIAPTMARRLGIPVPSGSTGSVLSEAAP